MPLGHSLSIHEQKFRGVQQCPEQILNRLTPITIGREAFQGRLAFCLAADLLAGAGRPSEHLDTVSQSTRFSESVDQTQDNPREPESELDFEVLLSALRSEGEEFYLVGLRNTYYTNRVSIRYEKCEVE